MYFCRMESEPEETPLDLPNVPIQQINLNSIATLKSSVPLLTSGIPFVDQHNSLANSSVER